VFLFIRTIIWHIYYYESLKNTRAFAICIFFVSEIDEPNNVAHCCIAVNCYVWRYTVFVFHLFQISLQSEDRRNEFMFVYYLTPTFLLTPCSRILLENLTGSHTIKKFPAFYGTRMSITAFTSARHLSLSWASSIQSVPPHPTSWRSILILSSHLRLALPSGLFP
jgi:succinate-acetate transporter protein